MQVLNSLNLCNFSMGILQHYRILTYGDTGTCSSKFLFEFCFINMIQYLLGTNCIQTKKGTAVSQNFLQTSFTLFWYWETKVFKKITIMNDFTKVTMIVAKTTGILGWKTSFHRRISLISYAYYLPLERSYLSLMSRTCDSVFQNPQYLCPE